MVALLSRAFGRSALSRPSTHISNSVRAFSQSRHGQAAQQRSTLSKLWVPTGGVSAAEGETGHGKLIRAGFLRQSQSGIFHLLPLGVRVQDKISSLLDKHMQDLGASRLSLSSITTEELWRKSGRLERVASELFRFNDRKQMALMLSPTHEEEITSLVANTVNSYKDLPLRLYQITRKYRDEIRPRHGLLRSKEFIMKDLYTFDLTIESAIQTYQDVSSAYKAFFSDLKVPILVAEASSGDMGGKHSHEYHLAHHIGEDIVATCNSCGYTANDEVAMVRRPSKRSTKNLHPSQFCVWRGMTKDRKTLINAWYPSKDGPTVEDRLNLHAIKAVVPELDTSVSDSVPFWKESLQNPEARLLNIIDSILAPNFEDLRGNLPVLPDGLAGSQVQQSSVTEDSSGEGLSLVRPTSGDRCPRCDTGVLEINRALELGHTFLLGTRYSEPLEATFSLPQSQGKPELLQMGCFGIGVSRILGALAEHLADDKGLNWPRAIAPFEVIVIPTSSVNEKTLELYDKLASRNSDGEGLDVVLDDRKESFGWKMQDADMTGYPVAVVLGRAWKEKGVCEVQCRRLGIKENVAAADVAQYVSGLLEQL